MTGCYDGEDPIQFKRAFDLFFNYSNLRFCADCELLVAPGVNDYQICRCDLYDHFVGDRWLCIPCFFAEETKAYSRFNKIVEWSKSTQQWFHVSDP